MNILPKINLLIDASHRMNHAESTTDFNVHLTTALKVRGVSLKTFCLPLCSHNITTSNNYMSFNIGTSPPTIFSITLSPGKYTAASIVTAINEKLTLTLSDAGLFEIAYDEVRGKFTMTLLPEALTPENGLFFLTGTLTADLGFEAGVPNACNVSAIYFPKFLNTMEYFKLSLTYLDGNVMSIDNSQISTTFIIENHLDIADNYMFKKLFITNDTDNNGVKSHIYGEPITLQNFKVTLRNHNDEIVNLNGLNWYCILAIQTCEEQVFEGIATGSGKSSLPLWMRSG